jgi:tetratricopeptide (TPR) repeat protein
MKIRTLAGICILLAIGHISANAQAGAPVNPSEKNPKAIELIKEAMRLESAMLFAGAIDKYKEVLKLEPKDFAAMNTIAGLYGNLGQPEQEVVWAQKAVDTSPKYWQGYINLGNGLAMQSKFDTANKSYQKALELAPNDPLPVYSLGVVAENQRDIKKALDLYKRSIELDPKFEDGLFSAAAMHANLKQFPEAKALLNKLLAINPKAEDARQMLQQIEKEMF